MGGPPPVEPPSPSGAGPVPGPPSYGPPYYPYPPPPLKPHNSAIIIVIVVVIVFAVIAALGAILYVMVAGLIRGPNPPPMVLLGPAEITDGNATLRVTSSKGIDPSSLQLTLQANRSASFQSVMPAPDGSVAVSVGGYTLRVFWFDPGQDRLLSTGDSFSITGSLAPLPARTDFSMILKSASGQLFVESDWTTP